MTHYTTVLKSKVLVLADENGHARTYANRAGAEKWARKVDGEVWQSPLSRVFYVRVNVAHAGEHIN